MQRPAPGMPPQYRGYPPQQRPANMPVARAPGPMMQHPQQPHGAHPQQYAQHVAAQQRAHQQQQQQHHQQQQRAQMPAAAPRMHDQEELMRQQQARNLAERPTDYNLPEGIDKLVIGDLPAQYRKLREFEKKLDAVMMRKNMEYDERLKQRGRRSKKMRVWISNTVDNQPWQQTTDDMDANTFDFGSDKIATYRLKIQARLHDDDDELNFEDEEEKQEHDAEKVKLRPTRTRFSHFFEKILIEFDRSKDLQPDAATAVEWVKPSGFLPSDRDLPKTADFDSLSFERKGDENINCTVHLFRDMHFGQGDDSDEAYTLSDDLAWIVGHEEATRGEIISAIFDYARAEGLQQDDDRRIIQCDDRLRKIFATPTISFPALPALITHDQFSHIQPLKPITLPYTIRVDQEFHSDSQPTVYDIMVPAEDLLHERLLAAREYNPEWVPNLMAVKDLDRQLALVIQAVNAGKSRHSFFRSMEKNPATFMNRWNSSQKRDYEMIIGDSISETGWNPTNTSDGKLPTISQTLHLPGERWRRGGTNSIWSSQQVREAATLALSKGKNIKAQ